ncbi:MAG: PQQ-binding-like beta-propeller repeat protein, partial [Prolixibacteraceae bacterium]|nr:PQQ-binding-like beta-propeller repeat protein [Prolixibacteraceae bacterium]
MKNLFILLLLTIAYTGCTQQTNFKTCGIDEIDQTRMDIKKQPTTADNALSRRAALYRWWRLLCHQGYDMDAFDENAQMLLLFPDSALKGQQSITAGFLKLEEIMDIGKKIPEIRGKKSITNSTVTNWPLYHGTDATQSGYSPDEGPSTGNIVWKYAKSYGCDISPIIDSGRVYLPGVGDDVVAYCLDETTGDVVWKGRKYGTEYYHNLSLQNTAMLTEKRLLVKAGGRFRVFDKNTGEYLSQSKLLLDNSTPATTHPKIVKVGLNRILYIDAQTGKTIRTIYSQNKISGQAVLFDKYVFYTTYDGMLIAKSLEVEYKNWQKKYQQVLDGSISVNQDGTLYLGTNEGYLLAVNASNGNVKWKFSTKHLEPRSKQLFSEVFIHGDRLFLGSANNTVYCLNANNGKINWEFKVDDWVRSKPFFIDEYLYVATLSGTMYAINVHANSPRLKWQTKVEEHGFTANLNGSQKGILGVDQNQMLYSISPKTGKIQWRHSLLDGVFIEGDFYSSEELNGQQSSPVVVDGVLYIGGTDGFVNAIDVESGKEKWRFETDGVMASSPTVAFGKVFFGEAYNASGTYYAVDKETGKPVWESEAYGKVWVNATFDDKYIYFGNMDGYFFAVNPQNGKTIWQYYTAKDTPLEHIDISKKYGHGFPPGVYCNPAYKNGVVYTGSWVGYYFAFEANNGKLRWRVKTKPEGADGGLPDSSAPVLYKNHLYVQKAGQQLAAINIETGLIDWEWTAPPGYLQNGTATAFNKKIFGSIIRQLTTIPYDASIIAFSDVDNGGKELWRYQGGGGLTAAVATKDKLIFGSSGDVFVTCLNPENGEVKW